VLSFVAFSWGPSEAAAELPTAVQPAVQVIAFDPEALADAELPSLRTGEPTELRDAGVQLARRGDHAQALPYLEAAAVRLPDDPTLHLQLGDTRLALGDVDLARQHYRAAEKAGSTEAPLRLRLLGS
jgi:Flp pilus assembly protein TadD